MAPIPCLSNQSMAFWASSFLNPKSLNNLVSSNFSSRGSVRLRLIENRIIAPITDPRVEARITPIRVNLVPLTLAKSLKLYNKFIRVYLI